MKMPHVFMIDNYDSFTYNLVQYFGELGAQVTVKRNDEITIADIEAAAPTHLCLSPGPCTPNEAGICLEALDHFKGKLPILGVCLGHQAIGQVFGGHIVRAKAPMHGKVDALHHHNDGVFKGLPTTFNVTRYHSLIIERETLPPELKITAWTGASPDTGEIMGVRHTIFNIEGVQFHPESILSEHGHAMLKAFLNQTQP
ncbi:anthranilate synthase component II [Hydromonas duriensis]|uniref:Anthranilate synthase component II n=1 Tax=Hydromonas duriensis TaxID=1527608 RepID=A0A4V3DK91_9BURK|nr:aminodeoxychorismate/anthranilate synthase component II [Hydromonas duriensis]TDR33050.1 anthranilate synthase component II [Hydromonas duriensis]